MKEEFVLSHMKLTFEISNDTIAYGFTHSVAGYYYGSGTIRISSKESDSELTKIFSNYLPEGKYFSGLSLFMWELFRLPTINRTKYGILHYFIRKGLSKLCDKKVCNVRSDYDDAHSYTLNPDVYLYNTQGKSVGIIRKFGDPHWFYGKIIV